MKDLLKAIFNISILSAILYLILASLSCRETPETPTPKVASNTKVTVFAFVAPWCEPCNRAKLSLSVIRKAGVSVWIIDIDKTPDFAIAYEITSVPTFLVYVEGKRTTRTQDISVVVRIVKENTK